MKFFEQFLERFPPDNKLSPPNFASTPDADLNILLSKYGGSPFGQNIFQLLTSEQRSLLDDSYANLINRKEERYTWFGRNWMGNLFGIFESKNSTKIVMLEFGGGEVFEVADDLPSFFANMTNWPDEDNGYLNPLFFKKWMNMSQKALRKEECAGYVTPLFLGGVDDETNLERINVEVYWTIMIQLISKMR